MGYPLVNVYKKRWTIPPCFMGKLTISTGPFSIAMCMFTRGYLFSIAMEHDPFIDGLPIKTCDFPWLSGCSSGCSDVSEDHADTSISSSHGCPWRQVFFNNHGDDWGCPISQIMVKSRSIRRSCQLSEKDWEKDCRKAPPKRYVSW